MKPIRPPSPGILAIVASVIGFIFAAFATFDYAQGLDRQLHSTYCSFIPGLVEATSGPNACTAALYSPYSSIFRGSYWGGIPISLFALGVYAFFFAYGLYLLLARRSASRRSWQSFALLTAGPLVVSLCMFAISLVKLGVFCKLCIGLYVASALLAVSGWLAWKYSGGVAITPSDPDWYPTDPTAKPIGAPAPWYMDLPPDGADIPLGKASLVGMMVLSIAAFAVLPALVYVAALPDYRPYLSGCGVLTESGEKHNALVNIPTAHPVARAVMFVDPLCPSCKSFHERLVGDGFFDRLGINVAMFPLDSDCNWMVTQSVHPGACVVAKAFICADHLARSRELLEWAYGDQQTLQEAGKLGKEVVRNRIRERFPEIDPCLDAHDTQTRLDRMMQFAVANRIPVSTPQFFIGGKRLCEEDTDIGLSYTINQLAPQVAK